MMKEALAYFPLKLMPLTALFLFIAVFVGAVLWVNRKGSKAHYDRLSQFPLQDASEENLS